MFDSLSNEEFFELVGLTKEHIVDFSERYASSLSNVGAPRVLSTFDETFLIFIYLKHYPAKLLLGSIFRISKQTAHNVLTIRMMPWLYSHLKPKLNWMSPEYRLRNSETLIGIKYTFLLDGFETKVYKPSSPINNIAFHSGKKGYFSINVVLFVCPKTKRVFGMTCAHGGGDNDPKVVWSDDQSWVKELLPIERGLGDSIFKQMSDLHIDAIPEKTLPNYSEFCRVRVAVENAIAMLRDFRVLNSTVRESNKSPQVLLRKFEQICTIIAVLNNDYRNTL